jgi:tetratricopeptide (TPR) repeat protein
MSRWKKAIFALVAVLLVLGAAELVLWVAGVPSLLAERDPFRGFSRSVRVYQEAPGGELMATPPRAVRQSFNYQEFLREKPENGYRVFTLGGSSAYGFPWGAEQAFTRLLGEALQTTYPDRKVEAVNAAAMSYASHRLRVLLHELVDYEPDLVVVYSGHNEFVETRFYRELLERQESLDLVRGLLYRWRLYSVLTRLVEGAGDGAGESLADGEERSLGEILGLDVAREATIRRGAEEKSEAAAAFAENVRALVDLARGAGADIVLCTVPANLRDWRPDESYFAESLSPELRKKIEDDLELAEAALERGDPASALPPLEEARARAPGHAGIRFLLGRTYEALERWEEAAAAYGEARDLDGQPARVLSDFNEILREVAREKEVPLLDAERIFEESSPHGLVGFNLVEDYVHPNLEGHRLIARELFALILEEGLVDDRPLLEKTELARASERAFPRAAAGEEPSGGAQTPAMLFNLGIVLENQGQLEEAREKYEAALALDPGYYVARCNLGRILNLQGRPDLAAAHFRRALEVNPGHLQGLIGFGDSLRSLQRPAEAEGLYRRALAVDPGAGRGWLGLGLSLAEQNRLQEAVPAFRKAVEVEPEEADAWFCLAQALLFLGQTDESILTFRRCLAVRSDHLGARNGLADALARKGERVEAERLYRSVLELNPGDPWARRGLAALGGAAGPER